MDAGIRNAADKDLGDRANKVFSQLMHLKRVNWYIMILLLVQIFK